MLQCNSDVLTTINNEKNLQGQQKSSVLPNTFIFKRDENSMAQRKQ